jgi:hypothetical protein
VGETLSTLIAGFVAFVSPLFAGLMDKPAYPEFADQACHAGDGRTRITDDLHDITLGGPTSVALGYPENASFGDLRVYVGDGSPDALPGICAVNAATWRTAGEPILRSVKLYAVDRGIEQSSQGRELAANYGRDLRQIGPVTTELDEAFVEAKTVVCIDPARPSDCTDASLYIIVRPQPAQ